ncbi:TIGR04372 family glycosyltransferase, partial [Candidatus Woesearchaeota archaeon]|nr:TIGR04372 family glycosyltransferase [Candidatus Woesearchaeota archaeon]
MSYSLIPSFKDKLNPRLLVNLLHSVWAIPCVLIIRLLRPIILIRIGTLFSGRIGHFAKDAGIQWIENKTNGNDINIYWLDKDTCNKQWEKMVRRNFFVHAWVEYVHVWNKYIYGGEKHYRPSSITGSRDIKGLLESNNFGMLKFLEDEEKEAKEWLINKGWNDGEPFVCIQVRDTAYLGSEEFHLNYDWDYHDYRNSNISTYILAIKWLLEQGVFVLRMGKKVNKKTPFNHPKFVDYPFCSDKSDLLDIWLFANCNLCISTGSGPDAISDIYRRPVVFLNYLPLVDMFSWS